MSDDGFDMDPRASSLRIGVELEYPRAPSWDEKLTGFGKRSGSLRDRVRDHGWPSHIGGRPVHDGTVGLEVLSPDTGPDGGMELVDAPKWYADAVEYLEEEWTEPFSPSGIMENSTAGLHLHISPLTRDQARELYKLSTTSWAKVLFCSSIASNDERNDWRVFRGGDYCDFNGDVVEHTRSTHYACVNDRGRGHYEWRMPEPVIPEHMEIIVKFLRLFEQDTEEAIQYAQEVLDAGDDRVTAIRRAEAVGMDIEEHPSVRREACAETEDFFETIQSRWDLPEIHTVGLGDQQYYIFPTRLRGTWEVGGVEFSNNEVLYADTLEPVGDDVLLDDVRRAFSRRGAETVNETDATHVVKDIVKKKKGKV